MAYTALQFNANALYQPINKALHGFAPGTIVRFNGVDFVRAQADSEANAAVVGMVSSVPDANSFYITQVGFVAGLTLQAYTPGDVYYLDPIMSGQLTNVKPTAAGQIELPCFIAYTADSGFFSASEGTLISSGPLFGWVVVNADTQMLVNTGYLINGAAPLTMTMPAVSAIGDIIRVASFGANGMTVLMNPGQTLNFVEVSTSAGGQLDLLATDGVLRGALEIVCTNASVEFEMISGNGNWDVL
jgi:hypothetical protein